MIKVGIAGLGNWGGILLRNFREHEEFEVVAAAVKHPERLRDGLDGIPLMSTDALLLRQGIDAVVVATPTETHFDLGERVLRSGRDLFMEKIFTLTAREGVILADLARDNDLKIFVDYTFAFSAAIAQMKQLVDDGEIGQISAIHLAMEQTGTFGHDVYQLLGCHMLSLLHLFAPLDSLNFARFDIDVKKGLVEEGRILFRSRTGNIAGTIDLSLNNNRTTRMVRIVGEKDGERKVLTYNGKSADFPLSLATYRPVGKVKGKDTKVKTDFKKEFDEGNNLHHVLDYFANYLKGVIGYPSNVEIAVLINQVLERTHLKF